MDENKTTNTNPESGAGEKTFSQDDVNRIVGERLAAEKRKGEAALAEREQRFAERERQLANREALVDLKDQIKEMGLPVELLPVLNVQDKDALKTALDALKVHIDQKCKSASQIKIIPNILQTGEPDTDDCVDSQLRKLMRLTRGRTAEE